LFITAGDPSKPAMLLLHGFPSSAREFRNVIPELSQAAYVIAPDLPGYGQSDVLPSASFAAFSDAISELLDHLAIERRFIYLHDSGAAVGLLIAMHAPELVSGLIIQNANAHRTGFGPLWDATLKFWSEPTKENEAAATVDLTFEFTREQYTGGLPEDVAATIRGEPWVEDWRVMNLPGRMETQHALIADYKNHAARFDAIAKYLKKWQPPALMLWGHHDPYFDLAETLSWMQDLPRMEAHIFDGGHFLLETHAAAALSLMLDFIRRTQRDGRDS
jgi:pimeloyl-ACP methyl ester carboxylesterase